MTAVDRLADALWAIPAVRAALQERDRRFAQAGADAAVKHLVERGLLNAAAGGRILIRRTVERDDRGLITAIVDTVEPREAAEGGSR